jgi:D-3-phosphoglycerate dehydrogenase / 2-oxoglutarate reductase
MISCLIVDEMHTSIVPMLKEAGIVPDFRPLISKEEVHKIIGNYQGLIVRSKLEVNKELLDKAPGLKFIGRAGAGMDMIDTAEAEKKKILLFNAPEGNRDALAEHCIALLLSLMNRILIADKEVRMGIWEREGNRGHELKNKTISIIGYGNMGKAFAERLKAFGCEILTYDKNMKNFSDGLAREAGMQEVFEKSDIVSFHIPLNSDTKGSIDENYMKSFKKNIWLINTARGEILSLKDLNKLLKSGKVRGAGLDVLENEKLHQLNEEQKKVYDELVRSDKVIFTPHIAGWSIESYVRINEVLVEKIKKSGIL